MKSDDGGGEESVWHWEAKDLRASMLSSCSDCRDEKPNE